MKECANCYHKLSQEEVDTGASICSACVNANDADDDRSEVLGPLPDGLGRLVHFDAFCRLLVPGDARMARPEMNKTFTFPDGFTPCPECTGPKATPLAQ